MTRLKTQLVQPDVQATPRPFGGLLTGLSPGAVLSWGLLEVVSLRLAPGGDPGSRERFATPGIGTTCGRVCHFEFDRSRELSPFAHCALYFDGSVHGLDERFGDSESQTGTLNEL